MTGGRTGSSDLVLAEALGLDPLSIPAGSATCRVIALTGGGGKTSALFRLGSELSRHARVIVTTTTRILMPENWPSGRFTVIGCGGEQFEKGRLDSDLTEAAAARSPLLVAGRVGEDGKLTGIGPAVVDLLAVAGLAGYILVEADGAAGRPLKGPAAHEPVIPSSSSMVIPVAGMDSLGKPLDGGVAHRPELVSTLVGLRPGARIEPSHIARLLVSPAGNVKGAPEGAAVVALLNKAETFHRLRGALQVARILLEEGIERVVVAALRTPVPVRRVMLPPAPPRVGGIILAAGMSRRFGEANKLLSEVEGKSLIRRVVEAALGSLLDPLVVILGHEEDQVAEDLEGYPVRLISNHAYREGQSTSLTAGIQALPRETEAAAVILGDQAGITASVIDRLLDAYRRSGAPIVIPSCGDELRHPVILSRSLFSELLQLSGDRGGRQVVERHRHRAEVVTFAPQHQNIFKDIDSLDDLERWRGRDR